MDHLFQQVRTLETSHFHLHPAAFKVQAVILLLQVTELWSNQNLNTHSKNKTRNLCGKVFNNSQQTTVIQACIKISCSEQQSTLANWWQADGDQASHLPFSFALLWL